MSPLRHDALRVGLAPHRILIARYARGLRSRLAAKELMTFSPAATTPPWRAPVDTLRQALPGRAKGAEITVVLSNHFVRYALLPWNRELRGEAEWLAFARHAFASIYGTVAEDWEIKVSRQDFGSPSVASAIDGALLPELREACKAAGSSLVSVQPYIMSAFNRTRKALGKSAAWLAVSEPGRITLGLVCNGAWRAIRTRKTNGEAASLSETIRREVIVSGLADCDRVVFVGEPEPTQVGATLHRIEDRTLRPGDAPDARPYAMVLA